MSPWMKSRRCSARFRTTVSTYSPDAPETMAKLFFYNQPRWPFRQSGNGRSQADEIANSSPYQDAAFISKITGRWLSSVVQISTAFSNLLKYFTLQWGANGVWERFSVPGVDLRCRGELR